MEKVTDWKSLRELTSGISRRSEGYTSNLYLSHADVEILIAKEALWQIAIPGALIILRNDDKFFRVYHLAENNLSLEIALKSIPRNVYVSDLIDRPEHGDKIISSYIKSGFKAHTILKRMTLIKESKKIDFITNKKFIASTEDVLSIHSLLERQLDPYSEQIPNIEDIKREVQQEHILIVRHGSDVAGMIMYELRGHMAHLRLWHVDNRFQGRGIGKSLMTIFLNRCCQAHRILLWVIASNTRSVSIYERYGFVFDGLQDQIMIRPQESLR
jgi:ribosomal protein S18 acetylase RimI-like enzyme